MAHIMPAVTALWSSTGHWIVTTAAPDGLARAARMIRADLRPLTAGDGFARVPFTAHLVTAAAPGS